MQSDLVGGGSKGERIYEIAWVEITVLGREDRRGTAGMKPERCLPISKSLLSSERSDRDQTTKDILLHLTGQR